MTAAPVSTVSAEDARAPVEKMLADMSAETTAASIGTSNLARLARGTPRNPQRLDGRDDDHPASQRKTP